MARLKLEDLSETPSLRETLLDQPEASSPQPGSDALDPDQIRAELFSEEPLSLLREGINREQHRRQFEERGCVRVPNVFLPEVAGALYQSLHQEVPWELAFLDEENEVTVVPCEEEKNWSDQRRRARYEEIGDGARDRFQMLRDRYCLDPDSRDHLIDAFYNYMGSEEFQELAESITGVRYRFPLRVKATRMRPGHFLRMHDDRETPGFASVLQLTRNWLADWGGILHVMDRTGEIRESFFPEFNSLVFLKTPAVHYVSTVTPWAERPRYILNLPCRDNQRSRS